MGVPLSAEALPHDPAGWSALIATAHDAQVSPMLYSRLHQAGLLDRVPSMQQSLQLPVWRLTARNEQRTRELTSIARALHDAGIPLIPLKGACLDLWVYPRPGLRPMSDLDVLIPGADTARAAAVMLDMGYRCDKPLVEDVTVLQEVHHLPAFTHPTRHTHVEVHGTLASAQRSFVQSETIWKHAQPAEINGVPVLRLCPEHLLMHVCWHGVLLHRLQDTGLRIVLDVAMILQRFEHSLDWDLLLDQTRGAPWERAVALGIWAAQALLNAPVPVHAMQQLGLNDLPEPVTDAVRQSLFTTPFGGASPNGATCLAAVFTQPWRKRWEYLNRSLWRSPEFLATVYPDYS